MNTMEILPVIDTESLKQKANEYAMKGAIKEIEEFYTGYSSPYRKALKAELEKQEVGHGLELPDIIALINERLSNEIDTIANTAVAKSFLPMVSKFLTRMEKEIMFSEILKEYVRIKYDRSLEDIDNEDFQVTVEKNSTHGWLDINISYAYSESYRFTLHEVWETRNEAEKKYNLYSLPRGEYGSNKNNMKIKYDNVEIEVPFVKDVLADDFVSYLARTILCGSHITMDTTYFLDDMFPQDECHCH